jgi:cytidine deaminase
VKDSDWQPLIAAAQAARQRAYAPYSNYHVGAALLGEDGQIHVGCNVENASYPVTLCAERVALSHAVSVGCRRFKALVVTTQGDRPVSPCGMCRQALNEFAPQIPIMLVPEKGPSRQVNLGDILPDAFGPSDLGK